MNNKVCLVTGANAGIGREVCLALAFRGAEVVMSARNTQEAEKVRDQIIAQTGNNKIHLIAADLSSFQGVTVLSKEFTSKFQRLDVLINNAGIFLSRYTETADGVETQWMVNYLAPYLLTRRLMDRLKAASEARIINVSSNAHLRGTINFSNLNNSADYQGFKAYAQSKLGNVLFTKYLAEWLKPSNISSFSVHPGVVRTGIGDKNSQGWMAWVWSLAKPFMISPAKGASTIVYLATSDKIQHQSGAYFINKTPSPSSKDSIDPGIAKRLWQVSEDMVKDYL